MMLSDISTVGEARQYRAWAWRAFDRSSTAAIGKDRRDDLRSELGHLVDAQRQHVRRKSCAEPRQGVDDGLAVLPSWNNTMASLPPALR